jgi:glycosyltransferase involved in cell wall biosynthesis
MRILTVCSNYRVFGAETITLKMLEGFRQNGHEQLAVTSIFTDGEYSRRLQMIGIPERQLGLGAVTKKLSLKAMWWMANTLARLPTALVKWTRILREFQPDVVVFTGSRQCLLLYPWLSRQPSVLIEFTNVEVSDSNRRLYRMLAPKLSCFVAVSDFMREHLHRVGAPRDKIRVVKSGTFFEREKRATEQPLNISVQKKNGSFRIGCVGQIAPNKGHDCLLKAARLLKDRGNKLVVQIFGSGDLQYENELKGEIAAANLTEIWNWKGYERDKAKIFANMDVCVVPSCFGDPFPTVAMEAGVYGLPVVASRIGGLPEIVENGVTGWLVEANSPVQLADKLEWLIRHPDTAQEMGEAGREKIFQHFTVERMVSNFEALFREFLLR